MKSKMPAEWAAKTELNQYLRSTFEKDEDEKLYIAWRLYAFPQGGDNMIPAETGECREGTGSPQTRRLGGTCDDSKE